MDSWMTSSSATPLRFYGSRMDCLQSVVGTLAHTFCACSYSPCRSKQSPPAPCGGRTGARSGQWQVASAPRVQLILPIASDTAGHFQKRLVPGSTSVRTVGIVWDTFTEGMVSDCRTDDAETGYVKQSCIDDLEKVILTATCAGLWVILTGRAEYAAGQLASSQCLPEPDSARPVPCGSSTMLTSSISRSHTSLVRSTTSFRTCFVRSLRGARTRTRSLCCASWYSRDGSKMFCPTDRSQVFDVNKDLLESVLLNLPRVFPPPQHACPPQPLRDEEGCQ